MMAQQGVLVGSTLAFWVGCAAAEVAPVVSRLREMLLNSARVFADETVVPVLDPGRGRTKQGYFWAIARDDRPWAGTDPPPWSTHTHLLESIIMRPCCWVVMMALCSAAATGPISSWLDRRTAIRL
jgi:hypothetical protein